MIRWLPRFSLCQWTGADADDFGQFEGWSLQIVWGRWILDLCGGRER